jgi:hypothetical protein
MSLSLEEWVQENSAMDLWHDLTIHVECAGPEDFPRLAMISIRQWIEDKNGSLR